MGHLGPDLLGPDWDSDEAVRRLAALPEREIAVALLDQRNLAGIGNFYKCELLFLRGVSPWTRWLRPATSRRWSRWPSGCSSPTATGGSR